MAATILIWQQRGLLQNIRWQLPGQCREQVVLVADHRRLLHIFLQIVITRRSLAKTSLKQKVQALFKLFLHIFLQIMPELSASVACAVSACIWGRRPTQLNQGVPTSHSWAMVHMRAGGYSAGIKNGREPFLTSRSDGQKGGGHEWQT